MKTYRDGDYSGERALFMTNDAVLFNCRFHDGESPLKESKNLELHGCTFQWKYPLWNVKDVTVMDTTLEETARSGIWYAYNLKMTHCTINAPKTFRYAKKVEIESCRIENAQETFWNCNGIKIKSVYAKGDYFGFHSENVEVNGFGLDGNYCFDSAKNVVVRNAHLNSKDAFWNCENVTCINCTIIGEYLGWHSKNLNFINCTIESNQGLCYINGLRMINCRLIKTDLCFEYCYNIDAEITTHIDSIKNPYYGRIHADSIGEIIFDDPKIDPNLTKIIVNKQ